MKGPWIKLWRSFLTDPTIQTLLKRYGHVTVTLLVALLTVTDDGIVVTSSEEIADLCGIDDEKYLDLIEKIMAKGVIFRNNDGNIEFKNWKKYQQSESLDRVRRYREKERYSNVTEALQISVCNENVTGRIKKIEDRRYIEENVAKAPRIPSERFIKPTVEELKAYCDERKNTIDPHRFFDHYESTGWKVGKNPMKNWQAAIRTWEKNSFDKPAAPAPVKAKEPRCACGGTINPAGLCRLCMKEFYTYGDDDE
jgi:hypothetical protein